MRRWLKIVTAQVVTETEDPKLFGVVESAAVAIDPTAIVAVEDGEPHTIIRTNDGESYPVKEPLAEILNALDHLDRQMKEDAEAEAKGIAHDERPLC